MSAPLVALAIQGGVLTGLWEIFFPLFFPRAFLLKTSTLVHAELKGKECFQTSRAARLEAPVRLAWGPESMGGPGRAEQGSLEWVEVRGGPRGRNHELGGGEVLSEVGVEC